MAVELARTGRTATEPTRRLFTVDEYYRMAEAGVFAPDEHVELIEGEIFRMCAIGSRHAACVCGLNEMCFDRFRGLVHVRVQNPVRLHNRSEPEPDIALLRPRPDRYAGRHPGPGDVFLIVEVADTSINYDVHTKLPMYARSEIPEVWVVDLNRRVLTAHRDPTPEGYRTALPLRAGDQVAPLAFPDRPLSVAAILGEPEPAATGE